MALRDIISSNVANFIRAQSSLTVYNYNIEIDFRKVFVVRSSVEF